MSEALETFSLAASDAVQLSGRQ